MIATYHHIATPRRFQAKCFASDGILTAPLRHDRCCSSYTNTTLSPCEELYADSIRVSVVCNTEMHRQLAIGSLKYKLRDKSAETVANQVRFHLGVQTGLIIFRLLSSSHVKYRCAPSA